MKFLDFNKSFGYVLATLLCLVFLGASYFFIYLPANEKRVEEQRFRTLQNIDRNIHDKMENSVSLLNNLLTPYDASTKGYFTDYINEYSKEKFILDTIDEVKLTDTIGLKNGVDSAINIEVNDATRQITITLQKPDKDKKVILKVSLKFSFKQFLTGLLPEAVFDEYLVFSKGNTVYESFPSGISNANEDSLLNIKDGVGGSHVKNITAGGKNYKFFLHSVTFEQDKKWILGGLLSAKRYQKERAQLPAAIVMLMVTLVLGMIVIFPWVKLYQMGSKDRLTLMDGSSCIIVTMLLMSLIFFCFFKYNSSFRSNRSPDSKKILANKISDAFYNETRKHYYILKGFNSIRIKNNVTKNIVRLQKRDLAFKNKSTNEDADEVLDSDSIKADLDRVKDTTTDIKQAFWLDSSGAEIYNWTAERQNAPLGNFATRNYFKSISSDKTFYLDGNNNEKFYLDQVVSWTSGTFTSLVSLPAGSPSKYVAAMSFTMRSVENAILPPGYSFAIIDKQGKVLYHSIKSKNLNENLKSEFSDSASITSCLEAGIEGEFVTGYYSKSYSVRISPFQNLPYSIVIFSDIGYKEIRDVEIYSFTFSMMLLLFMYIVVQLTITFLVSSRRSIFKKQVFDTSRTGPKISSHRDYILASAVNLVVIAILIIVYQWASFLQYIFLLLFAVTFISLFITWLLAIRYHAEGKKSKYKYKMIGVYWLLALLVILNICAAFLLECSHFLIVLLMELAIVGAGLLLVPNVSTVPANIRTALTTKWNYTHSFSLMTLTGLIITSGIPVAFFYITSYNYEQNLGIRHRQTDYANQLLDQRKWKVTNTTNATLTYDTTATYFDSTWISKRPTVVKQEEIAFKPENSFEDIQTIKIFGTFRLAINDKANKTNKLHIPYSTDSSVVYKPLFINANSDSSVTTYRKTSINGNYLALDSRHLNYTTPPFLGKEIVYWLFFLVALVLFYFIIHNIVKKLFCLNLPNLSLWKELDDKLLTDNKLNKFLFVIGLPGAGKLTRILYKLKEQEITCNEKRLMYNAIDDDNNNVLVADLINIPDKGIDIEKDEDWIAFKEKVTDIKYSLVIINHFEYNIQDEFTNLTKLNLLEQLMLKRRCKIIVLSTIHPVAFLDSINENVKKVDPNAKNAHDLDRWHVLLGHYRISIMPITKEETTYDPAWHKLLSTETEYTHFLQDMQKATLDIARKILEDEVDVKTDELAYKLQVTAHYFYMYIWQSLTKEEKFLLYDLAEDNLVNSYDDYNLTMLIAKGVIINSDGSLSFFNRGFRNFILTAVGNTEAMKIKDRIREDGNWSNLKIPLVIVILAILSFLLISQQEAYSKLLTYVAALSAGVPAVLKLFSLFDKSTTKTNT